MLLPRKVGRGDDLRFATEVWKPIPGFSHYSVSNFGRIEKTTTGRLMRMSPNQTGHLKINLIADADGLQYTRSVAVLVAQSFVEAPHSSCTEVVLLDGNLTNTAAHNLVWRPPGYAYDYARQIHTPQPNQYMVLPIINNMLGIEYASIYDCGMSEGLLFEALWTAVHTGRPLFPNWHTYRLA